MKKLLLALALLMTLPAAAQHPRAKDFNTVTDSLRVRLQRRTGVNSIFKLDKLLLRGNVLDFYYSQNFSAFPWRSADVTWFRQQLQELGADALQGYPIGHIYANKQLLTELPTPLLGNNGKALPTELRVTDPRRQTPALVRDNDDWPQGLSGRHIALWQSHGRYWEPTQDGWVWQRSANHRTVEDIFTQSFVVPFLMPMLENAGAVVLCPRERDIQTHEVVCDNDPAFSGPREEGIRLEGHYSEKGSWRDAGCGFADAQATYRDYDNPFTMGSARVSDGSKNAWAEWRPDIPEKGEYAVYVSYKTLPGSSTDARYTVHHAGGESLLHVNQKMGGGTWVYLGTFLFDKGKDGYVQLSGRGGDGAAVTADAVRFGGGMGKVERGGTTSGLPAFVEGALYNLQWSGIDLKLMDEWEREYTKDYAGRGKWVQEMSGGSRVNPKAEGRGIPVDLSLAWHTDAGATPNDSIIGTLAIYTLLSKHSDQLPNGESRMNGRLLGDLVQTQLVDDIRAQYEPEWTRRQLWDRSYSECRTTGVPGLLLELLSHLNFADMRYGLDPAFRFTAARAVYKGMLKYLSARYGCTYAVQPLPVHAFRVKLEDGVAVLSWQGTQDPLEPTALPASYRIYTRVDDGGFDAGISTTEQLYAMPIEEGHLYSFKITACNPGGESFPSEILALGLPQKSKAKVLVVNNFTRVSAPAWFDTPQYAGFTDDLDSGVPWGTDILFAGQVNQFARTRPWVEGEYASFGACATDHAGEVIAGNSFDFVAAHGKALMDAGYAFCSSSSEAFDGQSDAFTVDLICGKQVTTRVGRGAVPDKFQVFPEALQQALRRYTSKGGNVLISGAYIGTDAWDAVYQGVQRPGDETRQFVKDVLGYEWQTNFGDKQGVVVPAGGAQLPTCTYNRDWNRTIYRVENPDGIRPASAQTSILMRYQKSGIPAATLYKGKGYQVAAFGFPLETSEQLPELLQSTLQLLEGR